MTLTKQEIGDVVRRIADNDGLPWKFYTLQHIPMHPEDDMEDDYGQLNQDEIVGIRYAIRWGYLEQSIVGDPCHADEVPAFSAALLTLTRDGFDFLNSLDMSWLSRQIKSLGDNILTIAISVITALAIAWVGFYFDPERIMEEEKRQEVSSPVRDK